ncbi:MAG TPA: hypothetical protein VK625_17145 [Flavitalea sp.]|nr:hypothetical protein [Flavitalea sp.]
MKISYKRTMSGICIVLMASFCCITSDANGQINAKEHIYIQTDKNGYIAGETVFFKAYLYLQFAPSDLSSSLIIELSDLSGDVASKVVLPVIGGVSSGSIHISEKLHHGVYFLHAVTKKNSAFSAHQIYSQVIYVFNPLIKDTRENVYTVNSSSKNTGSILHEPAFSFRDTSTGKIINYDFGINALSETYTIIGVMEHNTVFRYKFLLKGSAQKIHVPVTDLPAGPLTLILIDKDNKLLSHHNILVENKSSFLPVTLNFDTLNLTPGGKNSFSINFPDSVSGTFSIAITDWNKDVHPQRRNMTQTFLENTELSDFEINGSGEYVSKVTWLPDTNFISIKGHIEGGAQKNKIAEGDITFFFQNKDQTNFISVPEIDENGNLLMNKLLFDDTATVSYQWKHKKKNQTISFEKAGDLFNEKNLAPQELPPYDPNILLDSQYLDLSGKIYNYVLNGAHMTLLDTVTVKGKYRNPTEIVNAKYTNGFFRHSNMARVLDLINNPPIAGTNILDYLQGKIPGLLIVRANSGYRITSTRVASVANLEPHVVLYLDEQMTTPDFVTTISLNSIALVKYYAPGNSGMLGIGNVGVLSIWIKKPADLANTSANGFQDKFQYPGYSVTQNFSDYQTQMDFDRIKEKLTLYWNPDIYIDGFNNSRKFDFFNSASSKKIRIVIEGFSADGRLLSFEKIVE